MLNRFVKAEFIFSVLKASLSGNVKINKFIASDYLRFDLKTETKSDVLFKLTSKVHIRKTRHKYIITNIIQVISGLGGMITCVNLAGMYISMPFSFINFNIALAKEYFNQDQ